FTPCATNAGFVGPGAGFPINFFQANPYGARIPVTMMNDDGYSNYNSLQIDFRQQLWHGLQFDANYTWSHTLGVSTPNDWTGAFTQFTLRDLKHSYGPTLFDLRHVVHVGATYDLPFGRGKQLLSGSSRAVDHIVGGWTVGTIMTYQTGFPVRLSTGFQTFNNLADSGVNLNGISREQLQNAVGVFRFPGTNRVSLINPNLLNTSTNASGAVIFNSADTSLLTPHTTPGQFAPPLYIFGPHGFYDDISISKSFVITERWRFSLQTLLINAFNHPVFGQTTNWGIPTNIRGSNFATVNSQTNDPGGFGRQIEFRLNIHF
ncbi:MAG: TonB-dependent receptor, partial [Candidatus Acidiferrales bacterium]